jgi:hypothetical protein
MLVAAALAVSLLAFPVGAAGTATVTFSDISDHDTVTAVETLRLLGVLGGYGDGTFRPNGNLTRAQFCKMAVCALNQGNSLGLYRTVTVFPDVKPSHWAAAYINMAAKGEHIIAGYPDGNFYPDRTVTVGQAVTILLRLLGYKDEDAGGVWLEGYMAIGATVGLTDNVGTDGSKALTRAQAARLFLNLLRTDRKDGGSYLSTIGTPVEDQILVSAAAGTDGKQLQTGDGKVYQLAGGKTSSGALNGVKGTLVLDGAGKVLTFVPDAAGSSRTITLSSCTATQITDSTGAKYTLKSGTTTYYNGEETTWGETAPWLHSGAGVTLYLDAAGTVSYVFVGGGSTASGAVIVYEDRSSAGFDALTGGAANYAIYKNGVSAALGDLRKYDVVTYSGATNSIRVCDTRVTVYYEACSPSPAEPSEITVLNGTKFSVLPTAVESLSKFKPGQQMTLLLTEDGQVAGAVEASGTTARGNAVGIVQDGKVQLLCGTAKIQVNAGDTEAYDGQLVRVSSSAKEKVNLSRLTGGVSGDLNVDTKQLGTKDLAENVMIFENGQDTSLSQLTSGLIRSGQIVYARTNWAGKVDLIVLGDISGSTVIYGRAVVRSVTESEDGDTQVVTYLEVVSGDGQTTGSLRTGYSVRNGDYVAVTLNSAKTGYASLMTLTKLAGVSNSAWSGQTAVTVSGRTYTVPSNVLCYNRDTGSWMTLAQAHAYATQANLYVKDGTVRVIEVSH